MQDSQGWKMYQIMELLFLEFFWGFPENIKVTNSGPKAEDFLLINFLVTYVIQVYSQAGTRQDICGM
jgi:hypothetical protein